MLKVDFEKVYDSVCQNYLKYAINKTSFGFIQLLWMKYCVFSGSIYILVDGSTTKEFKTKRGLR